MTNLGAGSYTALEGTDAKFSIGRVEGLSQVSKAGNISDVAVYSKELSASEVSTIYNNRNGYNHSTGVASANLTGWWRMGDGVENATGTTIYDASVNSNNAILTNMDGSEFQQDTP